MLPVHGGNDGPAESGTAEHHHRHPMSDHLPQVNEYLDPVEIKEQFQFINSINNELKHRPLLSSVTLLCSHILFQKITLSQNSQNSP